MSNTWLSQTAAQVAVQRAITNTPTTIVRHATVIETDIGTFIHAVQLDADGVTIRAHDITHNGVSIGDRVTVVFAPPHQALIIGSPIHDPWHIVGANGQVQFAPGWGHDASAVAIDTHGPAQVMFRREGRMVMVRGVAARTSGSSVDIFTLPQGYRPRNSLLIPTLTGGGVASFVVIEISGDIAVPTANTPQHLSIQFTTT